MRARNFEVIAKTVSSTEGKLGVVADIKQCSTCLVAVRFVRGTILNFSLLQSSVAVVCLFFFLLYIPAHDTLKITDRPLN